MDLEAKKLILFFCYAAWLLNKKEEEEDCRLQQAKMHLKSKNLLGVTLSILEIVG